MPQKSFVDYIFLLTLYLSLPPLPPKISSCHLVSSIFKKHLLWAESGGGSGVQSLRHNPCSQEVLSRLASQTRDHLRSFPPPMALILAGTCLYFLGREKDHLQTTRQELEIVRKQQLTIIQHLPFVRYYSMNLTHVFLKPFLFVPFHQ